VDIFRYLAFEKVRPSTEEDSVWLVPRIYSGNTLLCRDCGDLNIFSEYSFCLWQSQRCLPSHILHG